MNLIGKKVYKILGLSFLFVMAFALTFFVIQKTNALKEQPRIKIVPKGEKIPGLSEGDIVNLPTITSLNGNSVALKESKEAYFLCAFFSPDCAGCTKDSAIWRDLAAEAEKRNMGFYLISVNKDQASVSSFTEAYGFKNLNVFFDPDGTAAQNFKISLVPEYLLLSKDGRVIGRWSGIRRYKDQQEYANQLAEFFQRAQN